MTAMGQAAVGEMELAGQRYRTDVEAATSVWDTQERLRFGGWQQEQQNWQSEHLARMGGILELFRGYGEQMPQWLSNWLALYKLWGESDEPGAPGSTKRSLQRVADWAAFNKLYGESGEPGAPGSEKS